MTDSVSITPEAPPGWDEATVERHGGHVYQSTAWAEHRRSSGWQPLFVSIGEARVLALSRSWPLVGGGSAYIPRGPAPTVPSDRLGEVLWATTRALAADGIDVVAADPEVPASDMTWASWLRRAGFHEIDEIQPSRHRLTLPLGEGATDETVLAGISKSTRQRIRKAEREQITVVRHDARASAGVGDGFRPPAESSSVALDRFYDLLLDTAERRHFSFGPRGDFVAWWSRALAAGHLVYLEARAGGPHGDPLAGLVLYRHGGRLSTVHSGDLEVSRRTHPGALHLLRWRAIELAIHEGCTEMDLGGVDVAGARREPAEGEPMYGLYQHKLSFGARWLALSGAHERVIRPNRYRAGTLLSRATRIGEIAVSRIAR